MRNMQLLSCFLIASSVVAQAPIAPGVGGSIQLPDFDPSKQTQKVLDSLGRLSAVQDTIKASQDRIGPLIANFQKNPSLDNRELLEREVATLTQNLYRNVDRVLGEKEKVRFAMQDLVRHSNMAERSVEMMSNAIIAKINLETSIVEQQKQVLERLATAVEEAEAPAKAQALEAFKAAARKYSLATKRLSSLAALNANQGNMLRGIRAVRSGFVRISGNLSDVFARIEDAGALLAFVAGIRKESSDMLGQYQRLFGSGSESLREALTTLTSIEGQLQLVSSLTETLDSAGSFAGIVSEMESFSKSFDGTAPIPPSQETDSFWLDEVRKVTNGSYFQAPKASEPKAEPQIAPPAPTPARPAPPPGTSTTSAVKPMSINLR